MLPRGLVQHPMSVAQVHRDVYQGATCSLATNPSGRHEFGGGDGGLVSGVDACYAKQGLESWSEHVAGKKRGNERNEERIGRRGCRESPLRPTKE